MFMYLKENEDTTYRCDDLIQPAQQLLTSPYPSWVE